MREFLCLIFTGHGIARVEWRRVGQAERLYNVCTLCGHAETASIDQARKHYGLDDPDNESCLACGERVGGHTEDMAFRCANAE